MLQLAGIRITPDAENPICRVPLRTDIYQLAAQVNILNVPGSAVEARQSNSAAKNFYRKLTREIQSASVVSVTNQCYRDMNIF
ncbi:vacuolar protein sorting-associated protein 13B-like [Temnothorax curvispinosus]|uniref:Vacuolar protein sorting-associated protein 13B-like n=1 Tax=Temnothorax curvispinosus TaxID=300111 RepID=A0A6J1R3B4_9HYME|nr:vacuolar protein sorting-associated protein 13B-like [Temnothorax curvispinosus]